MSIRVLNRTFYDRNSHAIAMRFAICEYHVRRPVFRNGNPHHYYYNQNDDGQHEAKRQQRKRLYTRAGLLVGGAGLYYWWHLESTPITDRKRFMSISVETEQKLGEQTADELLLQQASAMLPAWHPTVERVRRVAERLVSALEKDAESFELGKNLRWQVHVVESPSVNAIVLPTGDIFVFTGILPVAQDDDGLAAILGHEMAHALVRHGAERLSFFQFFQVASFLFKLFVSGDFSNPLEQILKNYVLYLPFSRLCESEADHIGLLLMARACYHPSAAISLWKRMQMVQSAAGSNLPSFLSTHPSSEDRIAQIQKWMPEAERAYNDSCPSAFAGFPLPK